MSRRAKLVPLALFALLVLTPTTLAANGSVRLATGDFTVGEGDGAATIAVVRSTAQGRGEVRYAAWHRTADHRLDYTPVRGRIDFADGQTQATFRVPIADDGNVEGRETIALGIYGAYPQSVGEPDRATLTIVDNDAVANERDALNPLALDPPPPADNPLEGATFYTNPSTNLAGLIIRQIRGRQPAAAQLLQTIADQPETKRFGAFNDRPGAAVAQYLARAQADQPGSVPLISTYRLKHVACGGYSDTPEEVERYKAWYEKFAEGIGNHRAVVFLEIDALITTKCLSRAGLKRRVDEVRSAIGSLAVLPHAVVYVDAGAGDAHNGRYIAKLLRKVRVFRIQGFFTNSTHQNWTRREVRYGRELIRRLGGRSHHVVNTAANGRGPLIPHSRVRFGNSYRCNAPGRGLGPRPTALVPPRYRNLDGLIWIGNPGRSAGECSKTPNPPPAGTFWVDYAVSLVRNADFRIR
ncbi:MAG TPA: glycoside hydrolase family 6 protein [Conexibacter sp.]|nr:glycoside hydrolase family 6 protein [Conexibacter sp.]